MYHNTTHSTGKTVKEYREKVLTQEQEILTFFKSFPHQKFTASDVLRAMIAGKKLDYQVPMTSIRRGITNLMNRNKVEKTTQQRKGPYGRPEYCYQYATGQQDLFK